MPIPFYVVYGRFPTTVAELSSCHCMTRKICKICTFCPFTEHMMAPAPGGETASSWKEPGSLGGCVGLSLPSSDHL